MGSCDKCCVNFIRPDNLKRHQRYSCKSSSADGSYHRTDDAFKNKISPKHDDNNSAGLTQDVSVRQGDIPTFDGAEFSGEKPKSRATLFKMMEMLKIPEHRRKKIATDMLKEDAAILKSSGKNMEH